MEVQRLTSLPVEVLSRILVYVDSSDISAVKKTCQTLRSVTMTRQFWYNRIHRLREEHVVSPPEEELEEYTIAELEQWSMRRIRARSTSPVKLHLRSGPDTIPWGAICVDSSLLPGGRWLLMICDDSRVYFNDLDSSNLEQHLLLDPRKIDPRVSQRRVVGNCILCIDHKAPRLSFRIEGSFIDKEGDLPSTWVYIYQVNLTGHGTNATLVARIIATFRNPQKNDSMFVSDAVNDRYFVQERGHELSTTPQLEIFDYRQALERFDYPLIEYHTHPLENYPSDLEFINEDVIAFYCDTTFSYHIFNVESPTSLHHLHQIKLPEVASFTFKTRWTPKATLITLVEDHYPRDTKTLHGIVIPHEHRSLPRTVELGTITAEKVQGVRVNLELGIFNSVLYNGKDNISRIIHRWNYLCESPSISGPPYISILRQDVDHSSTTFTSEEDTGRFFYFRNRRLNVVDIVTAA